MTAGSELCGLGLTGFAGLGGGCVGLLSLAISRYEGKD